MGTGAKTTRPSWLHLHGCMAFRCFRCADPTLLVESMITSYISPSPCAYGHIYEKFLEVGWQGQRVRALVTVKAAAVLPSIEAPQSGLRRRTGAQTGTQPRPFSPLPPGGAHSPCRKGSVGKGRPEPGSSELEGGTWFSLGGTGVRGGEGTFRWSCSPALSSLGM